MPTNNGIPGVVVQVAEGFDFNISLRAAAAVKCMPTLYTLQPGNGMLGSKFYLCNSEEYTSVVR